jgi:hypothetical protein
VLEPVACEAHNRIKDAGYRRKQERVETGSRGWFNPLISPENPCRTAAVGEAGDHGGDRLGLAGRPRRSLARARLSIVWDKISAGLPFPELEPRDKRHASDYLGE